jgi:hypothetical protein
VLDEFRAFRHIVRNVYAFQLDPVKLRRLVQEAPSAAAQLRMELVAFADFLIHRAEDL